MENGIVKWFNDAKGYGFIRSISDKKEFLAYSRNIMDDPQTLFENQQVIFERSFSDLGPEAKNIIVDKTLSKENFCFHEKNISVVENKFYNIPRISVFDNVLSDEFCDRIIQKHTLAGMNENSGGQSRQESYAQVTEMVEKRGISLGVDPYDYDILATAIVTYAEIPYSHIEAIDVYNYPVGNYLDLHHDYPYDPRQINYYKFGGDRVGTGIFYFNDDFDGGETYFPKLGVRIFPKKGSFLYFEQCYDEETNWSTIHESTLITKGCKWIASCFFSDQPRVGYNKRSW